MRRSNAGLLLLALVAGAGWAAAEAPRGRYAVAAQSVRDLSTGLTWQTTAGPTVDFAQATSYCAALQLDGQSGFRLPTLKELHTLFDERSFTPAADARLRLSAVAILWSSTPPPGRPGLRWVFDFNPGVLDVGDVTQPLEVRCVRP